MSARKKLRKTGRKARRVIFEELRVPVELISRRAFITVFPILLAGCGGAPARAVAWEIEE